MYEEEHERKDAQEILRLAGVLDNIDEDVADLCIKIMPKGNDKLISMAELMDGVQGIKEKLMQSLSTSNEGTELKFKVSSAKASDKPCPNGCMYSRSMNQKYPRKCIICGAIEKQGSSLNYPLGKTAQNGEEENG